MEIPFRNTVSFTLFVFGLLLILTFINAINISYTEILGISLIVYSIPSVYLSFKYNNRLILVFSTTLFFVGILLLIKQIFLLTESREIYLISSLFILAAIFLMLYIENSKAKEFLVISSILFAVSIASFYLLKLIYLHTLLRKIDNLMLTFWPYFLIILGISLLLSVKH